uniref:Apelin receptor early endogenous ligand n=1 Tax=Sinocyclocheilus grahami TaxID=75366 RepID=A0A672K6P1_SINGR
HSHLPQLWRLCAINLVPVSDQAPAFIVNFLNLRRKYRRHNCPKKRCLPLHSRVPFP